MQEDSRADEYFIQEKEKEQELKEKRIKNEKQHKYYHSAKAVEKRRIKKVELQKLRAKRREESVKMLSDIFRNIFK